jgi:hypothetical protein
MHGSGSTRLLLPLALLVAACLAVAAPARADVLSGAVAQAAQPVTQAAAPVTQAAEPVTQSVEPAAKAAEPVVQAAAQPVAETVEPVVQAAAQPVARVTEPVTETAQPVVRAAERPAAETVARATEPVVRAATQPLTRAAEPVTRAATPSTAPAVRTPRAPANPFPVASAAHASPAPAHHRLVRRLRAEPLHLALPHLPVQPTDATPPTEAPRTVQPAPERRTTGNPAPRPDSPIPAAGTVSAAAGAATGAAGAALLAVLFALIVPHITRRLRASRPRWRPPMLVAPLERPG